ncbi:hypothetical protein DPMN_036082 [Dreissena polymorpha]|uniref:THAP-type domain-containing protein n=1 Tax=Dreissena polymorpha TaxID=45954 RepID=A0A9D4MBX2_DREPO|nr:hypothetical protein DPMN_036082 [Dreissena polymorpha]
MVQCAAFGCNARPEKGTKGFFGFPKDDAIKRKWIRAVNSGRLIDGKVVDFVPTKNLKLCIKHFEDKCFVHPPSVMASAGIGLRILLLTDAVPTLFPDTVNFKALQPKALKPDELGPPKRKRDTYGAFTKRNRITVRHYC